MPLSSGRFPKPDPPHPGTQGRGGVKTWRAFAGFPWACGHLLPAHTQLATFDPTKFELKRGRWVRSSSLRCRSGGGGRGTRKEEQRFMGSRLIKKRLGDDTITKYANTGCCLYPGKEHIVVQMRHLPSTFVGRSLNFERYGATQRSSSSKI